jgi:hypothetical protein
VEDTFNTNNILLDLACRTDNPILSRMSITDGRNESILRTRDDVVFKAYDRTSPTRPASTPVVIKADIARDATVKIIIAPTNSKRTASQRLTDILGR